jgi:hypothetical protein
MSILVAVNWEQRAALKMELLIMTALGRDSSVGIATRYGLDDPLIKSRLRGWGAARFSAPVQTGPGAHPVSYIMGTGSLPGVKRRGVMLITHPIAPRLMEE